VVVSEWVLRGRGSEMDRQVETDRPRNAKGNIGEFTHNETCQFECLKAGQRASFAASEEAILLFCYLWEPYFSISPHP